MFVHFTLKQAFLLFYLRLSPKRNFHFAVYGTMVMCTLFLGIEWLLAFLQAQPLAAMFHPEAYPNAKFLSQYVVQMVPTALVRNIAVFQQDKKLTFDCIERLFRHHHSDTAPSYHTQTANEQEAKGSRDRYYLLRIPVCRHGSLSICCSKTTHCRTRYRLYYGADDHCGGHRD